MDKSLFAELMEKRNNILLKGEVKKINPKNTIKNTNDNSEYLTINDNDFELLNKIYKQNTIIENNLQIISKNNKKDSELLNLVYKLNNSTYINSAKNTKAFVYLGLFLFIMQVILIGINDYLLLVVFN